MVILHLQAKSNYWNKVSALKSVAFILISAASLPVANHSVLDSQLHRYKCISSFIGKAKICGRFVLKIEYGFTY
jgi:hypothetical protein